MISNNLFLDRLFTPNVQSNSTFGLGSVVVRMEGTGRATLTNVRAAVVFE